MNGFRTQNREEEDFQSRWAEARRKDVRELAPGRRTSCQSSGTDCRWLGVCSVCATLTGGSTSDTNVGGHVIQINEKQKAKEKPCQFVSIIWWSASERRQCRVLVPPGRLDSIKRVQRPWPTLLSGVICSLLGLLGALGFGCATPKGAQACPRLKPRGHQGATKQQCLRGQALRR